MTASMWVAQAAQPIAKVSDVQVLVEPLLRLIHRDVDGRERHVEEERRGTVAAEKRHRLAGDQVGDVSLLLDSLVVAVPCVGVGAALVVMIVRPDAAG